MTRLFTFSKIWLAFNFLTLVLIFSQTAYSVGVLDRVFGTEGSVSTAVGASAQARSVLVQPDGKILVVGTVGSGDSQDTVLVRYNSNGSLDTGFGTSGVVIAALSPVDELINGVGLQSDGKIIVAGNIKLPATGAVDFLVARFTQNGTLDTTFGASGTATFDQSPTDIFNAVVVQPDDKIVAVGATSQNGWEFAALRFSPNGTLDSGFGSGGVVLLELSPFSNNHYFRSVKLLQNGRILIGGTAWDNGGTDVLVMLEPNGMLAADFGQGGFSGEFFGASESPSQTFDLAALPDGKILTLSKYGIRRRMINGAEDPSFRKVFGGSAENIAYAGTQIAVRSDGRFIALNQRRIGTQPFAYVYEPNGGDINHAKNVSGNDIALQNDDKFVVINSTGSNFVVSRYRAINSPGTRLADLDLDEKTDLFVRTPGQTVNLLKSSSGAGQSFDVEGRVVPELYLHVVPPGPQPSGIGVTFWKTDQNSLGHFGGNTGAGIRPGRRWGISGDIPVGFDRDGVTEEFINPTKSSEYAIFRPSDGTWWIVNRDGSHSVVQWGIKGDKPVPADYDYDGKTDYAVYRPSTGTWWILRSSDRLYMEIKFGIDSDIPLTGDFDGDGRTDFTVFRPSEGNWYQLLTTEGFRVVKWGIASDYPVPGDYDGDGKHDIAVYREGIWYLLQSSNGLRIVNWGAPGDLPVAVRYDQ